MKKFSLLPSTLLRPSVVASMLLFCATASAVDLLPTFNSAYYKEGAFVEKHTDKLVAVDAIIKKIEPGPGEKPILLVTLKDQPKQALWVASLVNMTPTMTPVGNRIKILGFFDLTKNEPDYMQKITDNKEYLLGFCFYDVTTKIPSYLPEWVKKCVDWETGESGQDISQ